MDNNLSLSDLRLKLGKFEDEKETLRIARSYNLVDSIDSLLKFNPEDNLGLNSESNIPHDEEVNMMIKNLNTAMFGKDLVRKLKDIQSSTPNEIVLSTNLSELDDFLDGGFRRGKIYEIQGPLLCGKSYFLNKLLLENYKGKQDDFLFVNTSTSFYEATLSKIQTAFQVKNLFEIKKSITVIDVSLLKELNQILRSLNRFKFILIDSLSDLHHEEKITEDLFEFSTLIKRLAWKNKTGVIFTSSANPISDKRILFDETSRTELTFNEMDIGENISSILPTDYRLTFYTESYLERDFRSYFKDKKVFILAQKFYGNTKNIFFRIK